MLDGFGGATSPAVMTDRRLAMNEHAERLLEAWWSIEPLLPKRSTVRASVGAWCTALSRPWPVPVEDGGTAERKAANQRSYESIRDAHEALKKSLRGELHRLG